MQGVTLAWLSLLRLELGDGFALTPEHSLNGFASLRIVAGAGGRAAVFPEFLPVPDAVGHLCGQWESELMREHADLAAMVGFVSEHVAEHFRAGRPRTGPAVSYEFLDTAGAA